MYKGETADELTWNQLINKIPEERRNDPVRIYLPHEKEMGEIVVFETVAQHKEEFPDSANKTFESLNEQQFVLFVQ